MNIDLFAGKQSKANDIKKENLLHKFFYCFENIKMLSAFQLYLQTIFMALDQVDIEKYDVDQKKTKEMSFIDHLEEFRWVMIRSLIGIGIMTALVFAFKGFFIDFIIFGPTKSDFVGYKILCNISQSIFKKDLLCFSNDLIIQNLRLSGQFMSHFQISFILGFVLAFPWVFWQLWLFIKPALYDAEKQAMRGLTFFAWFFFITGILFGYFLILPFSINFLYNYNLNESLENIYHLKDYLSYVTMVSLSAGIMFELPMVIFILSKLGLVTPKDLRTQRKIAFLIIIILSAIITPPDVGSMFLIAVPVYGLYELSILISAWVYKQEMKKVDIDEEKLESRTD